MLLVPLGVFLAQEPALHAATPPQITGITVVAGEIEVTASVPSGVRRVVLESSRRNDQLAWAPRGVQTVNGSTQVTFTLSTTNTLALELFRVRADDSTPLPASFYTGRTRFAAEAAGEFEGASAESQAWTLYATLGGFTGNDVTLGPVGDEAGSGQRTVEESDIWRARGDRLYFFNSTRGLQIIDIANPAAPALLAALPLAGMGEQLYLLGDDHVVLLVADRCDPSSSGHAIIVEVTNDQPREIARVPLDGSVLESRLVGSALYVATQTWEPAGTNGVWQQGVNIHSFGLAKPASPTTHAVHRRTGGGNVVAATPTHLFVSIAENTFPRKDALHVFDISDPTGVVQPLAEIPLSGALLDKFKLHQQGDLLAVVTEVRSNATLATELTTYRLLPPGSGVRWQKLGGVPFGLGESLFATRFDGTRLYAVTYLRVDPLWVVDFADPAQPVVRGELIIPGWSTYIHPLGDRLLSIGVDDTADNRVAVQLFDVADATKPALLSKVLLGASWSTSEALANEKALGVFPEEGLVLVPFTSWTTNGQQNAVQFIDLGRDTVTARGLFTETEMVPRRTLLRDDTVLAVSSRELLSIAADNRNQPLLKHRLELGYPVDRVLPVGDWLVEFSGNDVRVSRASAPGLALARYTLEGEPLLGATVEGEVIHLLQGTSSPSTHGFFVLWPGSTPRTNSGTLRHVVLDASALPALAKLGEDTWKAETTGHWSDAEPLWPEPGLLVWSLREPRYGWYPYPMVIDTIDLMPGFRGGGFAPYWSNEGSPQRLIAVDVTEPEAPEIVSETVLGNEARATSDAFAAEGLVLASQTVHRSEIVATNHYVQTNRVWITVTNEVWRTNYSAMLQVVTETNQPAPFTVEAIRFRQAAQALAAGWNHSLLLDPEGDVFAWGQNDSGAVGVKTSGVVTAPAKVVLPVPVASVAATLWQSFALGTDGALWTWGSLDGPMPPFPGEPPPDHSTPRPIALAQPLTALSGGGWHTLGLDATGQLWTWGHNEHGQLGLGHRQFIAAPQAVPGTQFQAVSGGLLHSLALDADGRVWSWGRNDQGQLGRTGAQEIPEEVALPENIAFRSVAAGGAHSLALTTDGQLWGWGHNVFHQLGSRAPGSGLAPQAVSGLPAIDAVAAGSHHTVALDQSGAVWFLGREPVSSTPVLARIEGLANVRTIVAGRAHSVAATAEGDVYVWGANLPVIGGGGETVLLTLASELPIITHRTNIVIVPEAFLDRIVQQELRIVVTTNSVPVWRHWNRHELLAIDYAQNPAAPVLRDAVELPGALEGVSHAGALLYCLQQPGSFSTNGPSSQLHALAYDGLAAHLVDSLVLTSNRNQHLPLLAVADDGLVVTARTAGTTNLVSHLETWHLNPQGRFTRLGQHASAQIPDTLILRDQTVVLRAQNQLVALDVSQPAAPTPLPINSATECLWLDLTRLQGTRPTGLWLPAGELGSLPLLQP